MTGRMGPVVTQRQTCLSTLAHPWPQWINSKGQVIGSGDTSSGVHALFWDPKIGQMEDLGTLSGTYSDAWSINSNGRVAGRSETAGGLVHGFVWDSKNKTMQDLGTLSGGIESGADDVNSRGWVVGYASDAGGYRQAVIWKP